MCLIGSAFGVADYNRTLDENECRLFEGPKIESSKLKAALNRIHAKAYGGNLAYHEILCSSNKTKELYYLAVLIREDKTHLSQNPELAGLSARELENVAAGLLQERALLLCRRSMIRNGLFYSWMKAMVADEFLKYYVVPVVAFFIPSVFCRKKIS